MLVELAIGAGAAVLLTRWRLRLGERRRWRDRLHVAMDAGDHEAVLAMARSVLPLMKDDVAAAHFRLSLASWLLSISRFAEGAEMLVFAGAKELPGHDLANWHNLRGFALAMVDDFAEAADELELAEIIVGDDDTPRGLSTYACVVGNRGVLSLRRGQLDEAQSLLEQARGMMTKLPEDDGEALKKYRREWHAETYYWLAEIAERRGNAAGARSLLGEAVALEGTEYGKRARQKLETA